MSILFTADVQAEWNSLDLCEQMWDEVLDICQKQKIKYIAILGDLKQAMNPVDIRVITWWQKVIRKAIKLGYVVIILLGNHDRIGAYSNADNWLSILRRAGAKVFDKPSTFTADDITLYLLPFDNETNTRLRALECKEMLRKHKKAYPKNVNVLCFHCDVRGVKYNNQGSVSDSKLTSKDLFFDSYDYVVGGHVHKPQKYYVGSPFCHDFGEVNQVKRYLVLR